MISFSFSSSSELFRKVLGHFILLGVKYNAKQIVALRGIHLNFSRNKVRPTECTRHDFIDGVSTSPSSFSLLIKIFLTTFGKNPAIRTFSYLLSRSKLSIFVSQITTSAGNNRARGTRQFLKRSWRPCLFTTRPRIWSRAPSLISLASNKLACILESILPAV